MVEVVEKAVIAKDVPVTHVPDPLPSREGADRSAKSCSERAPAGMVADEEN